MKAMIWGYWKDGLKVRERIQNSGLPVDIIGFVDRDRRKWNDKEGDLVVGSADLMVYYKKHLVDKIIIPSDYERDVFRSIIYDTAKLDIDKEDFIVPPIGFFRGEKTTDYDIDEFMVPWYRASHLDYIEFAVTDSCNLNCKRCARFASLVKERTFNYHEIMKDFRQLKTIVDHVGMIRLMGGEPLLDPELYLYLDELRELYPYTELCIVTNGLLIPQISERLIESVKKNQAKFHISYYPPLEKTISKVYEFLEKNSLDYEDFNGEVFYKSFNFKSDDNIRQKKTYCLQWCINLREGRIFPCASAACYKLFEDVFHTGIPLEAGFDIYDEALDIIKLKEGLDRPMNFCRYCDFSKMYLWEKQVGQPQIEDWDISG